MKQRQIASCVISCARNLAASWLLRDSKCATFWRFYCAGAPNGGLVLQRGAKCKKQKSVDTRIVLPCEVASPPGVKHLP
eukprot:scaffold214284_cov17-Prasinocladus_malaysianus.AAC.2